MRKKAIWTAALLLIVLGVAAYIFYRQSSVRFDGDRIVSADPASFSLRFNVLNTADSQTLTFREGDTLRVSWLIESGSVDLVIAMEGETPLYQANGRGKGDEAAFDNPVP